MFSHFGSPAGADTTWTLSELGTAWNKSYGRHPAPEGSAPRIRRKGWRVADTDNQAARVRLRSGEDTGDRKRFSWRKSGSKHGEEEFCPHAGPHDEEGKAERKKDVCMCVR